MSRAPPETLTVQVPFVLRKRGGRKIVVMPEGAPVERIRIDNTLVKALARAFRWKKMIDSGAFATIGDLAAHEKMPPSYMTRVMRLTMLSPTIVEAIVAGQSVNGLAELMEPFPAEWAAQKASAEITERPNRICTELEWPISAK